MSLSRERVEALVTSIFGMGAEQIEAYRKKISLSGVDATARSLLYRACDMRAQELDRSAAIVVSSDTDDFE